MLKNTDEQNILYVLEHEGMHILNKHISRFLRVLSNEIDDSRKMMYMYFPYCNAINM
jgi:hypothetical protein